jgi:hypothetical protein
MGRIVRTGEDKLVYKTGMYQAALNEDLGGKAGLFLAIVWLGITSAIIMGFIVACDGNEKRMKHYAELFSLAWLAVVVLTFRARLVIDRRRGIVRRWCGLLVPMLWTTYDLTSFNTVMIRSGTRANVGRIRTRLHSEAIYDVSLVGDDRDDYMSIDADPDYARMQRVASDVAEFTGFGIYDLSDERP